MNLRKAALLPLWLAALLTILLLRPGSEGHLNLRPTTTQPPPAMPAASVVDRVPATNAATRTLRIPADQLLATVNGEPIRLEDLVPLDEASESAAHDLSEEAFTYLFDRAVTRALVLQEARRRGLELGEAQREQLSALRSRRSENGPGFVRNMNRTPAAVEFEMRDAEAFMLQTSLMAAAGSSPNVTSAQVLDYYARHASEFEPLPEDDAARRSSWEQIDADIRHRLASSVRAHYGRELASFMDGLRAAASIEVSARSEPAGQGGSPGAGPPGGPR
jgi:hypothetical protein